MVEAFGQDLGCGFWVLGFRKLDSAPVPDTWPSLLVTASGCRHNQGMPEFDVAIIGGGPGGSTLAALLAKQGRSVCIIERAEFPRFCIGESLLPFSVPVWERSGVLPKIHEHKYMIKPGARFVVDETLEEECFSFKNGLDDQHPYAFQVQRAPFDKLLLDHARELGVEVYQPTEAKSLEVTDDAAVLQTDQGEIRAKVVCDASGRNTFLSTRQRQRRHMKEHRKIACYGHFTDVTRCEQDEGNIIIVRFGETRKGWFWVIPFTDGTNSVGVVADADYFAQSGLSAHDFLMKSIRESRHVGPRMTGAKLCGNAGSEADFSYTSERHVGDRWLKIGDAGAFIDPIFSSGILLSTRAADEAATVLKAAFAAGDFSEAALKPYEERVRKATRVFWAFIDAFYNRDFLKQMVTSKRRPLLQRSITSLLAGDVYNDNNQVIKYLTGEGGAFADSETSNLIG
jgi:flavin-dependent dehydrogenase